MFWLPSLTLSLLNRNIMIGNINANGFIGCIISKTNIIFEDFYISNVAFTGESPFIYVSNTNTANYDTPTSLTGMNVRNGFVENMFEKNPNPLSSDAMRESGLFINLMGPSLMTVQNFTARNILLNSLNIFCFTA